MAGYRRTNRQGLPTTPTRPMARGQAPVNGDYFRAVNGASPGAGARARRIAAAQRAAALDRRRRLGGVGARYTI